MNGLTLLVYCLIAHQQPAQVGPGNGRVLLVLSFHDPDQLFLNRHL